MPGFDRTGPLGAGPMTGGGFGRCGGRVGSGRGFAPGRGHGRGGGRRGGRGRRFGGGGMWGGAIWGPGYGPPAWGLSRAFGPVEERSALEAEAADLRAELAAMEQRLAELKGSADK